MSDHRIPLWEQGRIKPLLAGELAIRMNRNIARTARREDNLLHQHTRDCRDPAHRARYARAHEQQGGR